MNDALIYRGSMIKYCLAVFGFLCAGLSISATDLQLIAQTAPNTLPVNTFVFSGPIHRPVVVDGKATNGYALEFRNGSDAWRFECISGSAGLITGFFLNGRNIFHGSKAGGAMIGSTFWISPQSRWNWPPPAELDSAEWTALIDEEAMKIELVSPVCRSLNVQVTKSYTVDLSIGAIVLTYSIANTGKAAREYAPWEITRVSPGGLSFYPAGTGKSRSGSFAAMPGMTALSTVWIDYRGTQGQRKLFADGAEGWLAHTDGSLLLLKSFDNIDPSQAAPGEAEIELFSTSAYGEVEQQGAYVSIPAGGSVSWQVTWLLRALPAGLKFEAGSQALLDYARTLALSGVPLE